MRINVDILLSSLISAAFMAFRLWVVTKINNFYNRSRWAIFNDASIIYFDCRRLVKKIINQNHPESAIVNLMLMEQNADNLFTKYCHTRSMRDARAFAASVTSLKNFIEQNFQREGEKA